MKRHSLITSLINFSGNARGCVYSEPLWGIAYNLYAPYISVYMLALGLSDRQIGLIASITWGVQILTMLFSGVMTDKLGRRRTTLIIDLLAWSLPALISALAQNYWFFLVAGLLNTLWRVAHNSWSCLLVEGTDPGQLVDVYTWIYIANQIVGFVAPLTGVLINAFGLVTTMRGLYFFATVMFAVKAFVTYYLTREPEQGLVRMQATRHQSVFSVLGEYKGVLRDLLHTPQTLFVAAILVTTNITWMITGNFWSIIVTQKLNIPEQYLALFPFIKSTIMLIFFFAIIPVINRVHFKVPLVLGFLGYIASLVLLVTAPVQGYVSLILSVCLEACSFAVVGPLMDKLTAVSVDPKERARILSLVFMAVVLITSPFGWVAGMLSEIDRALPFVLCLILYAIGAGLAYYVGSRNIIPTTEQA